MKAEEKQQQKCAYRGCWRPSMEGIFLYNENTPRFPDMGLHQGMHLECYIQHVIDERIGEKKETAHESRNHSSS